MKKRDFKALVLMGIASGAMTISGAVEAHETTTNLESTFAGGAGGCGAGGCGGSPMLQNKGSSCNGQPRGQGSCNGLRPRNDQNNTQTQRNTRYSRQIAEADETMPQQINDSTQTPTSQPRRNANGSCNGTSGCNGNGKNLPRQYRTRS